MRREFETGQTGLDGEINSQLKIGKELAQDQKPDFEFMTEPEQRELLGQRIEQLVDKVREEQVSNLVFLDKSARPLATLFSDLWHKKYPNQTEPLINFFNIGRETSSVLKETIKNYSGPYGLTDVNYQKKLDKIKSQKIINAIGEAEMARVQEEYRYLALANPGDKTLIIDEYSNTGESIMLAKKILQTAFPDLKFETFSVSEQESTLDENEALSGNKSILFFNKNGVYNPPWRFNSDKPDYGISGVVDPEQNSLTAQATRTYDLENRIVSIQESLAEIEDRINEYFSKLKTNVDRIEEKIKTMTSDQYWIRNKELNGEIGEITQHYIAENFDPVIKSASEALKYIAEISVKDHNKIDSSEWASFQNNVHALTKLIGADEELNPYAVGRELAAEYRSKGYRVGDNEVQDSFVNFRRQLRGSLDGLGDIFRLNKELQDKAEYQKQLADLMNIDYQAKINQLRQEMHHLADEYWENKKK